GYVIKLSVRLGLTMTDYNTTRVHLHGLHIERTLQYKEQKNA
ncbi:unnamed protein product, partial [Auanema sp. JU1783]